MSLTIRNSSFKSFSRELPSISTISRDRPWSSGGAVVFSRCAAYSMFPTLLCSIVVLMAWICSLQFNIASSSLSASCCQFHHCQPKSVIYSAIISNQFKFPGISRFGIRQNSSSFSSTIVLLSHYFLSKNNIFLLIRILSKSYNLFLSFRQQAHCHLQINFFISSNSFFPKFLHLL